MRDAGIDGRFVRHAGTRRMFRRSQSLFATQARSFRSEPGRLRGAYLVAPHLDARTNLVADFACAGKPLFARAGKRGRIWKTPVQPLGHTGKNRAAFSAGFVADRDHVSEQLAGFEDVEHGLSLILRNINPDFAHRFDGQRVERSRLQPSAVRFELTAANLVKKRLRHLAAGAVVNTDE
jgi:hypothetical protein